MKLPSELSSVQTVFHVSMLKKCIGNPEPTLPIEGIRVKEPLLWGGYGGNPWSPSEKVEDQRGGLCKSVMEKPPSWGRNMGGRGQHEVPLSSSLC